MSINRRLAIGAASAALAIVPAAALAQGPGNHGPSGKGQTSSNAKKYGKYCQGETKKHVKGQKGTPFSNCVNDMAKLAHSSSTTPRQACANETKKHVAGQEASPFSLCVSGGAKLRHDQNSGSTSG